MLILGSFNVFIVISTSYFQQHQLTSTETTTINISSYIAGILGSVIFSYLADKLKKYKLILVILNSCLLSFQIVMTILMEIFKSHKFYYYLILICYSCFGLTSIPIISIGIDFVSEVTYPIGEAISFGMVVSFSRVVGMITVNIFLFILKTFVFDFLINDTEIGKYDYLPNSIICLYFAVGTICFSIINGMCICIIR